MRLSRNFLSTALAITCGVSAVFSSGLAYGQEKDKDAKDGQIPVKRIVMFSSGVAFYERNGDVQGDTAIDLKFNTRDINDLLKSMVLQDDGGGRISTISYGSKDPITRALRTFSIDLTSNPTLADLLVQVRGEKIEIDSPSALTGTIVGIEKRTKPVGENKSVEVTYLNLLTDDGLRSVALDSVGRIKLSNPKLDAELRQALMVLAMGNTKDKKSVTLNFTGAGKRPVKVGYIQESPIWKTSYRLVLSDEKPLLQGWAIVENTTEEDWQNVNLTLISGRPISFVMDLYQPLYVDRPEVKPELYSSLRPRTYDQDLASADRDFGRAADEATNLKRLADGRGEGERLSRANAPAGPGGFAANGARMRGTAEQAGSERQMDMKRVAASVESAAQASDVGEMFQYKIATPVTVARQKSAMLPIVNESVAADKISIYNPGVHAKHPLNGLKFTNSTDLHLMQGPITVFDDGSYAGDAQIQDLPPKSERIISYAMDLDTEVAPTSSGDPEQLVSVKIVKGTIHATRKYGRKQSYVVKNSGKKEKNVLIEYALDTNWTLIEPKEATEKTRDQYRFAVKAQPGKPANLDVKEERTATQQFYVNNLDDGSIQYYINAKVVSDKVKQGLAEVIKKKAALGQLTVKRAELERQVQVIFEEQNRVRQNMTQLPKDSDLFRRYVTKFNEQEDKVEQLREQIKTALADEQAGRQALDKFIQELDLS
ncbi:hypothetical protein [Anatilimnocola floriformis]|uniref:hypothetical protein n=1 Tax=Anatilimnocola floriformis TaxID=2948575 RepID=UPI0020C3B473|nr:hypothetical protein [Anatilimnocola floriformis]